MDSLNGFIKLPRSFLGTKAASRPETAVIYLWCLLRANWKPGYFQGIEVPAGSFVCGQGELAAQVGMSRTSLQRWLRRLSEWGYIEAQAGNKWTLITILHWSEYQEVGFNPDGGRGQQPGNNRAADGQQADTIEEGKEEKEGKEEALPASPAELAAGQTIAAESVRAAWNTLSIRGLSAARTLTPKRISAIRARMRDPFWRAHWREAIDRIPASAFLLGANDRNWRADFDWFLNPDSVARIIEGKYECAKSQPKVLDCL